MKLSGAIPYHHPCRLGLRQVLVDGCCRRVDANHRSIVGENDALNTTKGHRGITGEWSTVDADRIATCSGSVQWDGTGDQSSEKWFRICVAVIGVIGVDIGIVGICDIRIGIGITGLRGRFEIIVKKPTVKEGTIGLQTDFAGAKQWDGEQKCGRFHRISRQDNNCSSPSIAHLEYFSSLVDARSMPMGSVPYFKSNLDSLRFCIDPVAWYVRDDAWIRLKSNVA